MMLQKSAHKLPLLSLIFTSAMAQDNLTFKDTCKDTDLAEQKTQAESNLTSEKRLLHFEKLVDDLSYLYKLKEFPKELPRPYILNCLKTKNKYLTTHVLRGGAPFRAKAQFNLLMGELEESRKNIKAAVVYYEKAQKLLPQDIEVAFKAADMWILSQISEQNNRNLKLDKKDPEWLRLELDFMARFEKIQKNPMASHLHKSRAETAIGRFYDGADEKAKAIEHYKKALELDPKNARAKDFLKALGS